MQRRSLIGTFCAAFVTGTMSLLGIRSRTASGQALGHGMMGGNMMSGDGMAEMMAPGNMMGPMRTGMSLFARHAQIRRTVTEIPGGVRAVTVSDDPKTASLIQAHVSEMYQRLEEKRAFPYMMSRSVPAMFAHNTRYRRKLEAVPNGIAITETSDEPEMVAVIRAHAEEISGFVREGMPAMMHGMMR